MIRTLFNKIFFPHYWGQKTRFDFSQNHLFFLNITTTKNLNPGLKLIFPIITEKKTKITKYKLIKNKFSKIKKIIYHRDILYIIYSILYINRDAPPGYIDDRQNLDPPVNKQTENKMTQTSLFLVFFLMIFSAQSVDYKTWFIAKPIICFTVYAKSIYNKIKGLFLDPIVLLLILIVNFYLILFFARSNITHGNLVLMILVGINVGIIVNLRIWMRLLVPPQTITFWIYFFVNRSIVHYILGYMTVFCILLYLIYVYQLAFPQPEPVCCITTNHMPVADCLLTDPQINAKPSRYELFAKSLHTKPQLNWDHFPNRKPSFPAFLQMPECKVHEMLTKPAGDSQNVLRVVLSENLMSTRRLCVIYTGREYPAGLVTINVNHTHFFQGSFKLILHGPYYRDGILINLSYNHAGGKRWPGF